MPSKTNDRYSDLELRGTTKKRSEKVEEKTSTKREEGSTTGKQHDASSPGTKDATKKANKGDTSNGSGKDMATSQKSDMSNATGCHDHWEEPEHLKKNLQAYKEFQERNRKSKGKADRKRENDANANGSNKKQKSNEVNHDAPSEAAGSKTRVPEKGQKALWHAEPGYVQGEVVEVVYEEKNVDGEKIEASKEEPQVVMKSTSTGKISVHKPETLYFD